MDLLKKNPSKKLLILVLVILFLLILSIDTPKYPEPILHPITTHPLTTFSGKKLQLEDAFPNRDYLLVFFAETSKTSLKQLQELNMITTKLPPTLVVICVHIGKMKRQLNFFRNSDLHLFLDPQTELSQKLQISTVPTVLLLNKNSQIVLFSNKFVPANELIGHISTLEKR